MELVGRMMDGSIPFGGGLEPSPSGPGVGRDERVSLLETVPMFRACSKRQLRSIAGICETFDVPAGTMLTRIGEPGEEFFLIVDGTVQVEVSTHRHVRLGAGEYFGEMSLLDGEPRSASVVAEGHLRLLVIRRPSFQKLLDETPGIARELLVTLSKRVREAERALSSRDVR